MLEQTLIWYARNFPIQRGKLRVVNNLWQLAARARGPQRIAVLKHGGLKAPCDLSEMLQRQFYFFGTYFLEREILALWADLARQVEVIFDIGANAGIYSLAALASNPDADVYAFEPTPQIADRLRSTVALNGLARLHVEEMAVSDATGNKTLRRCRGGQGADNGGMNFLVDGPATDDGDEQVCTVTLDDYCAERGLSRIDLLKMDIQGHEYAALRGAGGLLNRGAISCIFLELNWMEGDDCPAEACVRLLDRHGYLFSAPRGKPEWRPAGPWLRGLSDVVASLPEKGTVS